MEIGGEDDEESRRCVTGHFGTRSDSGRAPSLRALPRLARAAPKPCTCVRRLPREPPSAISTDRPRLTRPTRQGSRLAPFVLSLPGPSEAHTRPANALGPPARGMRLARLVRTFSARAPNGARGRKARTAITKGDQDRRPRPRRPLPGGSGDEQQAFADLETEHRALPNERPVRRARHRGRRGKAGRPPEAPSRHRRALPLLRPGEAASSSLGHPDPEDGQDGLAAPGRTVGLVRRRRTRADLGGGTYAALRPDWILDRE